MARRPGYATLAILKAVANGYKHGFDIIDITALPGGTVYPALARLESEGCLLSQWEDAQDRAAGGQTAAPVLHAAARG